MYNKFTINRKNCIKERFVAWFKIKKKKPKLVLIKKF